MNELHDYTDSGAVIPKRTPLSNVVSAVGRWIMFGVGLSCASVCLKTQERTAVDRESCVVSVMACKDMTEAWNKAEDAAKLRYEQASEKARWTEFIAWSAGTCQCVTQRLEYVDRFYIRIETNGFIRISAIGGK